MRSIQMVIKIEVANILTKLNSEALMLKKQINALDIQTRNLNPGKELQDRTSQMTSLSQQLQSIQTEINMHKQ
jgi:hypothetical protein